MSYLLIISIFWTFAFTCAAQPDTLLQNTAQTDTLLQDTTQLKEAPESLQKLIGEMKAQKEKVSKDADIELDGMLFDNTKTKSGKDFFDFFYSRWEAPPEAQDYSIYIIENPYRLMTTQIEVKINETTVFSSFLQPRADIVEQLAEYAVAQTRMYLANYEELMRQLESEDRAGTGIF
jgi:curli production assembly/transport component CsgE